ncbi:MAG: branched-chain amino acid ABC transporter permease [Candidatus Bathyarchaeia archaeon]|jgi:branched-chain amino acid transport system permease protein
MKTLKKPGRFTTYLLIISSILIVTSLLLRFPVFWLSLFNDILIYALVSYGWNIIGGYVNYFSFGQGVFFGIGAYIVAILTLDYNLPPYVTIPIAVGLAALAALAIGFPSLRLKGIYFAFSTVGINAVFLILFSLLPFAGPIGIILPLPKYADYYWTALPFVMLIIGITFAILLTRWISLSKFGMALNAIRSDEEVARVRGINTTKIKLMAFMLSAVPPAIAGGIYVIANLYIDPGTAFSTTTSMYAIATTMLGGGATVLGPLVGSTIFILLSETFTYTLQNYTGLPLLITGIIVIAVILFMRKGIIGELKKRWPKIP